MVPSDDVPDPPDTAADDVPDLADVPDVGEVDDVEDAQNPDDVDDAQDADDADTTDAAEPPTLRYRLVVVPPLPGGVESFGYGINPDRTIAGASHWSSGQASGTAAFVAPLDGSPQTLGALYGPSYGFAINATGHVTGYSYEPDVEPGVSHYARAFVWDGEQIANAGSPTLHMDVRAWAMNDAGQLAGECVQWPENIARGCRYTAEVGWEQYDAAFVFFGIAADGTLAGIGPAGGLVVSDGAVEMVPTLSGAETDLANAYAISPSGRFVAGLSPTVPGGTPETERAFRWDREGGALEDLGGIGGGFSQAFGVNDAGWVVGIAHGNLGKTAFLHRPGDETITDVNEFVAEAPPGWRLTDARGIDPGGAVVGTATRPASLPQAGVLVPLE